MKRLPVEKKRAIDVEMIRSFCGDDYEFPAWAEDYMARIEQALGSAYTEPAEEVRGYIAYVRSQAQEAAPA
jgi:hypothetical protein